LRTVELIDQDVGAGEIDLDVRPTLHAMRRHGPASWVLNAHSPPDGARMVAAGLAYEGCRLSHVTIPRVSAHPRLVAHHRRSDATGLASLLDLQHLPAAIRAARRTHPVWQPRGVTLRALAHGGTLYLVSSSTRIPACARGLLLRYGHGGPFLFPSSQNPESIPYDAGHFKGTGR